MNFIHLYNVEDINQAKFHTTHHQKAIINDLLVAHFENNSEQIFI